ncbi:dipeptidase [Aurantimonas sp. VKM B-3413]|uniref:dipeptidase n=1 Tax=Aurantimonas sp. VKM B-3413 TaxID=2779401 RepID=UPI001E5EDA38|nr:dipeptidase [Aurantimonas sp. VKM B-3413]MCB8838354.1 dipeptidase [Aurantimonas sp. VKM B-3413]
MTEGRTVDDVEAYLSENADAAIEELKAFCRIESVSTDPAYRSGISAAADFVAERLTRAGFPTVEIIETGGHPAVVAEWCAAPGAPTILVYGHYDVQPPDPLEKWASPPFSPDIRDDRLYARGASDDKGPVMIPILVAEAFAQTRGKPPLNVKMIVEGEEESGSPHLGETIARLKERLAADLVVSADGAMWRADLPSVTVASRGLIALDVTVSGASKDLHSGRHGGSAPNPVRALSRMLASLHDEAGRVAVPGFADDATPPDPAILDAIRASGFDPADYFRAIGAPLPDPLPSAEELLTRQWLEPTLEFNGISGGYSGPGTKTVIPSSASAKITCRLVAGQEPEAVCAAIETHLRRVTPTGYAIEVREHGPGSAAFALDPDEPALAITEDVLEGILGARPLRVAMGATIPIGAVFKEHLGAPLVFFSFSTADEDYHAPNEFFRLDSFRKGLIAWARLFDRLADGLPERATPER